VLTGTFMLTGPRGGEEEEGEVQYFMLTCCAFFCIRYINQQNALSKIQQNMNKKTCFMLSANSYMFRHQGSILREFSKQQRSIV
jgi:hypothetical protein